MVITWDQARMTTGVDEIDAQHQELIRRFNDFHEAVLHRKGRDVVAQTLVFLADYTRSHFTREEACMTAYRCPAAAANKAAHDELRAELAHIQARIDKDSVQSLDVVQLEVAMGNWIRSHICSIDVKLRDSVRKPGAGGTPS